MSTKPSNKLSIAVVFCAYNEEALITRTLESLMKQKRLPDEVIVVNNASTDNTAQVVQRFIDQHPDGHISLIYEPQKGLYHARDKGWRTAHSDVIASTDADTTFPDDWLEIIERQFAEPDVVAITGIIRFKDALPIINIMNGWVENQWIKSGGTHLHGPNSAVRRHVLEEIDGYVGKSHDEFEDRYLSKKIVAAGYKIRFVRKLKVWHTFRRFNKDGLWGYITYIFLYTAENIYPDHLSDDSPYSVAVVIPTNNAGKTIVACLSSLIEQFPRPHEIIVVDNASTDSTVEKVNAFIVAHPTLTIKLIPQPQKDNQLARKAGWSTAKSDIVVMAESNQSFPENWLAKVHAAFITTPQLGAIGGEVRIKPGLSLWRMTQLFQNLRLRWRNRNVVHLPEAMVAYRREALEKLNQAGNNVDQSGIERLGYKLRFRPSIYAVAIASKGH